MLLKEFESVFVNEGVWNGPVLNQPSQVSNAVDISPDMVLRKLQVLQIDKAVGPDGLHPMVLSKAAVHLAVPLSMIFNMSLQESKVPDDWKVADVVPVFKKGQQNLAANYRPVSLTSVVSKVMESILRDHIWSFLESNDALSQEQTRVYTRQVLSNQLDGNS